MLPAALQYREFSLKAYVRTDLSYVRFRAQRLLFSFARKQPLIMSIDGLVALAGRFREAIRV